MMRLILDSVVVGECVRVCDCAKWLSVDYVPRAEKGSCSWLLCETASAYEFCIGRSEEEGGVL